MEKTVQKENRPTLPVIGAIAGTRALLGAGLALLSGNNLSAPRRKAIGYALLGIGLLSTVPLAAKIISWRQGT